MKELKPDERKALEGEYLLRIGILQNLADKLQAVVIDALQSIKHIDRIYFRVKGCESFLKKALDKRRNYIEPLIEIEDQIAGRVLVFYEYDLEIVRKILDGTFHFIEADIKRPEEFNEFGYETDHYIFLIPKNMLPRQWNEYENLPTTAELQIRTLFMHAYAEPQHDIDFKGSGNLPNNIRRQLAWIAASAWGGDHAYSEIIRWMRESGKFPEIF